MTEPAELRDRAVELTGRWIEGTTSPHADIYWPDDVKAAVLRRVMKRTQDHCSFCDGFPVQGKSKNEIEHFVPKKQPAGAVETDDFFRSEAYAWRNLFYICSCCNCVKLAQWNGRLLKPDATAGIEGYDYEFAEWFECDRTPGN